MIDETGHQTAACCAKQHASTITRKLRRITRGHAADASVNRQSCQIQDWPTSRRLRMRCMASATFLVTHMGTYRTASCCCPLCGMRSQAATQTRLKIWACLQALALALLGLGDLLDGARVDGAQARLLFLHLLTAHQRRRPARPQPASALGGGSHSFHRHTFTPQKVTWMAPAP